MNRIQQPLAHVPQFRDEDRRGKVQVVLEPGCRVLGVRVWRHPDSVFAEAAIDMGARGDEIPNLLDCVAAELRIRAFRSTPTRRRFSDADARPIGLRGR